MSRIIKTISLVLVCAVILSVTACNKRIPDVDTVSRYSLDELTKFANTVDEKTLIKNWGEPIIANNERLWQLDVTGGTKYLVAYVEDGKVISIYNSETMFINVVLDNAGIKYERPHGAFYIFAKVPEAFGDDDSAFVEVLEKNLILCAPGKGFGMKGYFRIAYCVDQKTIVNSREAFYKAAHTSKN